MKVGRVLIIVNKNGNPDLCGATGRITRIDSNGNIYGTWGTDCLIPDVDEFAIYPSFCRRRRK